jgi:predicted lactoylglutathione lyase
VSLQLSMVGLMVRDMAASLEFYRRLGISIPEGSEEKPFVRKRMESGIVMFWDTVFANKYDPDRGVPKGGYRVMLEFFLRGEGAVDAKYEEMTRHGYHGRSEPVQTFGPYAAMVDDPDGNVVLLTAG